MANCRRPQVVFSVYKGNSCSSGNFVGSVRLLRSLRQNSEWIISSHSFNSYLLLQYITKSGVSEFLYYASTYDANYAYDDDSYSADNLVNCESSNYGYVGLGCTDSGNFALNYYNDQYCISRTGNTYDSLNRLNKVVGTYESCKTSYKYGDDKDYSLIHQLVYNSEPCMAQDYGYCSNSKEYNEWSSTSSYSNLKTSKWSSKGSFGAHKSWVTKLKYVIGGLFLLASFIMFTGILFTNRRRRRAMMMRKYRQAKRQKREKKKSRSSSRRRSKSKTKDKSEGGFLT